MGGIILEYVDQIFEISERVNDGDNIYFVRVTRSSGDQVPNRDKYIYSDHHRVSGMMQDRMQLSIK